MSGGITGYGNALAAGGTMLTICSDAGARDIMIGANGEELPQNHSCDDCCLAAPLIVKTSGLSPLEIPLSRMQLSAIRLSFSPALHFGSELARGPPAVV